MGIKSKAHSVSVGKVLVDFFDFPSTGPVLDLRLKTLLLAFLENTFFQATIGPAEHEILPAHIVSNAILSPAYVGLLAQPEDRAEVIRPVADIDNPVEVFPMALEEGL